MKRKRVWRYYCEYCGRGGCGGGHIARHERGCTANPNRDCSIHGYIGSPQPPMSELVAALMSCGDNWNAGMDALRRVADNCPACILAAIRQSGIQKPTPWDEENGSPPDLHFNFQEELTDFWREHNAERDRSQFYALHQG